MPNQLDPAWGGAGQDHPGSPHRRLGRRLVGLRADGLPQGCGANLREEENSGEHNLSEWPSLMIALFTSARLRVRTSTEPLKCADSMVPRKPVRLPFGRFLPVAHVLRFDDASFFSAPRTAPSAAFCSPLILMS